MNMGEHFGYTFLIKIQRCALEFEELTFQTYRLVLDGF